jgi:hypothetical protein
MTADQQASEQHVWSVLALLIYAAACFACIGLLAEYGDTAVAALHIFDLAIIGLATFRLIHLMTFDKIFDVVRTAFMDNEGGRLKNAERGWRRLACEFMQCIWCTGMWSGLVVVTAYCFGPWARLLMLVLAAAGLGSLLQVISKAFAARSEKTR